MAKRLKSRISAGAALVTGLGMMGIATAVPAQAATDLQYTCQTPLGAAPFQVSIDTDAPETIAAGETLTIPNVTGTVTLDSGTSNAAAGFLQIETLEGTTPAESKVTKDGEDVGATVSTDLVTAPTTFWDSEAGTWTQEGIDSANPEVVLPLAGTGGSIEVPEGSEGSYELHAPETFTSSFIGTKADGSTIPLEIPCTYESGNTVIDTVMITEPGSEPETDDWFTEPGSIPVQDNVITVTGDASRAGALWVVMLDSDMNELNRIQWDLVEGTNEKTATLVENTDHVRLISENCVDAQGNDETVEDSGCNVLYTAPWSDNTGDDETGDDETGDDQTGDDQTGDDQTGDDQTGDDQTGDDQTGDDQTGDEMTSDDAGDDAGDTQTGTPEIPEVVQTDGLTPTAMNQGDNSAALALGGLLLAGAGAGTVLVARRRATQH